MAVSDDPNKTAEENLASTSDGSASADEARAMGTNGHDGQAAAEAPPNDVDNTSEVVPVEQKPLSRPALHGSEEEKAKKAAEKPQVVKEVVEEIIEEEEEEDEEIEEE